MRKRLYEILELARMKDRISVIYDYMMIVTIVLSIIPLCFKQSNPLFLTIEYGTVAIFILDYLARWATADYKLAQYGNKAFALYPFTPYALIDLISILPVLTALNPGFKLLRLFRLNRALRIFKVLRYSKSFVLIRQVVKKEKSALLAVAYFSLGYIFLLALILFSVEPDTFSNFFDAIYCSVVTLTTVGYSDIYPTSMVGRTFAMISSFLGIAIVALPTGIITAGYMSALNDSKDDRQTYKHRKRL